MTISMLYVDRPVSDYVEDHLRHRPLFNATDAVLKPLPALMALALVFLLIHGLRRAVGQRPAPWTRTPVLGAWAMTWGLATAVVLKRLIGRSAAYPVWVLGHQYGFHLLHGREGFEAFPSGTMTVGGALLMVVWTRIPVWRPLWVVVLLLVIAGLIITDSHWIADIIAGTFIGATVGWLTPVLMPDEPATGEAS